ncbi:hypothetical protein RND71_016014 [Anisodus tanguticus]|uniref:Uncharacterized protein n=1 Tax=Anisodus tanguticus TaxID=243964 RepID=A0AAE1S923_9SOLA|nr:hypothetical protein RND71_016014 [Anisodus tanguticus]
MTGGSSTNELQKKEARLEALVGMTDNTDDLVDLLTQIHNGRQELNNLRDMVAAQLTEFRTTQDAAMAQAEALQKENEDLKTEVLILKKAVANVPRGGKGIELTLLR